MTTAGRVFEENRECEQQCRICATLIDRHNAVHIFAEDGRRHYLQTKIRKYLYILVTSEDKLSKMICSTCIKRLEGVHHFATMAYRTQEKLKLQLYEDSDDRISLEDSLDADNIQSAEEGSKKTEDLNLNRGLLHSALTKGSVEVLTDCESLGLPDVQVRQNTPNTEEMEVKIDPMLFLQCGMDQSNSESSDLSDDEERKHKFHTTESPSLTHKKQETKVGDKKNSKDSKHNHVWSHLSREKRFDGKPTNNVLHVNADNNSVGNFVCPICNKRISTKGNLKVHLETHRPKGKYGCDICGRIFKTQSNLFRHKEYHGGVQYPCNVCGRVYPTNSTLRAHSITHSDLRPHACPLCDKTFKRNQDLKFHINQHTGARPYQCPYCPKAFASSGNCFSHRKRMHPREVHRDRQRAADLMR